LSFVDFLLCALNEFRCFFVELCARSELCCLLAFCIVGKCCLFTICCLLLYIVRLLCALDEFHGLLVVHSWWVSLFSYYASLSCYKFHCLYILLSTRGEFYHLFVVNFVTSLLCTPHEFHPFLIMCHLFDICFQFVFVIIFLLIS